MKINSDGNNLIKVRVEPGSGEEKIIKKEDRLVLKIKEKAEKGAANKRVFELLALIFPQKGIELIKGSKSKNKIFKIHDKKN